MPLGARPSPERSLRAAENQVTVIAALLAWGVPTHALGANPIETVTRETGVWTLRFLALTLAATPLRRLAGVAD